MGKAYFDAVNKTVPGPFENGKIIMEGRILDKFIDKMSGGHGRTR